MYTQKNLKKIIRDTAEGKLAPQKAYEKLQHFLYEDLGFAKIDHHRGLRTCIPEMVFSPGKTIEQIVRIIRGLRKNGQPLVITRLEASQYTKIKKKLPFLLYSESGKIAYFSIEKNKKMKPTGKGEKNGPKKFIAILTAGTSDIPVAEEASTTLAVMGMYVEKFYDCGVAGIHRLFDVIPRLRQAQAIICIAGMEGALASVVAGLVASPIIAVPTSVGYGASFDGLAPLLTMLNACVPGVSVVNIDNGFGAACCALRIG